MHTDLLVQCSDGPLDIGVEIVPEIFKSLLAPMNKDAVNTNI